MKMFLLLMLILSVNAFGKTGRSAMLIGEHSETVWRDVEEHQSLVTTLRNSSELEDTLYVLHHAMIVLRLNYVIKN